MTDIVERLRDTPMLRSDIANGGLCREAADEIERLRALIPTKSLLSDDERRTLIKQQADTIERLRITVNDQAATITKLFEEVVKLQDRLKRATTS